MAEIPPPPENPFDSNHEYDPAQLGNGNGDEQGLPQGAPNVASKAGRAFLVVGMVGLGILVILYFIFAGGKKSEKSDEPKKAAVAPKRDIDIPLPPVETKIQAPLAIAPPVIPAPIKVPDSINLNPLTPQQDSAAKAQATARMRSNMMLTDSNAGGGVSGLLGGGSKAAAPTGDPSDAFMAANSTSKVETVTATHIAGLSRTIAQGRLIQATMETAVNTDLKAPIRAIVSRDTYGEAGTTPLIPKGSRLIGQYSTRLDPAQNRVFIIWNRVIRPDGVDIMLNSPGVDALGTAGVAGQVDDHFQEVFARSVMSSVMNIGLAIGSDSITGGNTTTTSSALGSTTSGDAASTATTNALNRLGSVTDSFIQRFINVPPTIVVDQGTKVNVFVNKDLVFPTNLDGSRVIN